MIKDCFDVKILCTNTPAAIAARENFVACSHYTNALRMPPDSRCYKR